MFRSVRSGFTFLETLVVVGLFSIISVSLFQTFSMGLKIWRLASSANFTERRAILGMERLTQDLRRVRPYAPVNFSGSAGGCQFGEVVNDRIYNVSYVFDAEEKNVRRRFVSIQESLGKEKEAPSRVVMTDVKKFLLSYYGFNAQDGSFAFSDSWSESSISLPFAVKATLELEGGKSLERIIVIPVSGGDD